MRRSSLLILLAIALQRIQRISSPLQAIAAQRRADNKPGPNCSQHSVVSPHVHTTCSETTKAARNLEDPESHCIQRLFYYTRLE